MHLQWPREAIYCSIPSHSTCTPAEVPLPWILPSFLYTLHDSYRLYKAKWKTVIAKSCQHLYFKALYLMNEVSGFLTIVPATHWISLFLWIDNELLCLLCGRHIYFEINLQSINWLRSLSELIAQVFNKYQTLAPWESLRALTTDTTQIPRTALTYCLINDHD